MTLEDNIASTRERINIGTHLKPLNFKFRERLGSPKFDILLDTAIRKIQYTFAKTRMHKPKCNPDDKRLWHNQWFLNGLILHDLRWIIVNDLSQTFNNLYSTSDNLSIIQSLIDPWMFFNNSISSCKASIYFWITYKPHFLKFDLSSNYLDILSMTFKWS